MSDGEFPAEHAASSSYWPRPLCSTLAVMRTAHAEPAPRPALTSCPSGPLDFGAHSVISEALFDDDQGEFDA